jgi:hypothetical protein
MFDPYSQQQWTGNFWDPQGAGPLGGLEGGLAATLNANDPSHIRHTSTASPPRRASLLACWRRSRTL